MRIAAGIIAIVLVAAAIAAGASAGLYFFLGINFWTGFAISAALINLVLIAADQLSHTRRLKKAESLSVDFNSFERNITRRLVRLEKDLSLVQDSSSTSKAKSYREAALQGLEQSNEIEPNQPGGLTPSTNPQLRTQQHRTRTLFEKTDEPIVPSIGAGSDQRDNVIPLNTHRTKESEPGKKIQKLKPKFIDQALEHNQLELYLQPILTLPERHAAFYLASLRLNHDQHSFGHDQLLVAAKTVKKISTLNLHAIRLGFKLLRDSERSQLGLNLVAPFFSQSLHPGEEFDRIVEAFKANQPLSDTIRFAIDQRDFVRLNSTQLQNLGKLRDLGYTMMLANIRNFVHLEAILDSGLFDMISVASDHLLGPDPDKIRFSNSRLGERIGRLTSHKNIQLVGCSVKDEPSAMGLIDMDINLALGDGLMPARPLKKNLAF